MGRLIGFDPTVFVDAATPGLIEIAEDIAAEVEPHYPTVEVAVDAGGVSVVTHGLFDHFKEWGSVNNSPLAYMRRAASARGNYTPEGK